MSNQALMGQAQSRGPVRPADPVAEVGQLLKRMGPEIMAALPRTSGLTVERLARIAMTTLRVNPGLMACTVPSLLGALVQCAQLGLEPDPRLGLAYLVPYKKSRKLPDGAWENTRECQLIIGYRGMIDLARRSGDVSTVESHVVYENDAFTCRYGMDGLLSHSPNLRGDRGEAFCVYAMARMKDGSCIWDVMTVADVERIRGRSKAQEDGPWQTDPEEMARKTVVRRLSKYLPMSVEWADAQSADGVVVSGIDAGRPVVSTPIIGEVADDGLPAPDGQPESDEMPA